MQPFISWLVRSEVHRSNRCPIMVLMSPHLLISLKVRETPRKLSKSNHSPPNTLIMTMKSRKLTMTTFICPRSPRLCPKTMKALPANNSIWLPKKISNRSMNRIVTLRRLPWMQSTRTTCKICKWEQVPTRRILTSQPDEAQIWPTL